MNAFNLINIEIGDLPLSDKEKLKLDSLIEQDKCLSEIDFIDGISVWEKGNEEICENDNGEKVYSRFKFKDQNIPEQYGGMSFFHKIGQTDWHVRIHKGE